MGPDTKFPQCTLVLDIRGDGRGERERQGYEGSVKVVVGV